jgi:hypothetical protein
VGAKITITTENSSQTDQVTGGGSYLSASDLRVHFGLDSSKIIKTLTIRWPSGTEDKFQDVKVNQILSIREGTAKAEVQIPPKTPSKQ